MAQAWTKLSKLIYSSKPPSLPLRVERYLRHGWIGEGSPHSLNAIHSTLATASPPLHTLQHRSHYLQMAYFNENCNFYSSPSTPEELGPYPFLQPQASVVAGEIYNGATPVFAGGWATVDQPGFAARPSTAQPTTTNYCENYITLFADLLLTHESLGPTHTVDSYPAQQHGSYWPTIGQSTQPDHTSVLNQGSFPLGGEGWGTGIPVLPVNPGKYHFGL